MDFTPLIGPAVVAAVVSGFISIVGMLVNRSTTIHLHTARLTADLKLAERKANADIALAEKKFDLDASLADRKRRQDLAEEVLSGFYQMADVVRSIRSPMRYEDEGKDRPRPAGESDAVARRRDTYYAIVARFESHRQEIANLLAKRYRMAAWFGNPAEEPFEQLHRALVAVRVSAQHLVQWTNEEGDVPRANPAHWQKMEANIWWGVADPDPVATPIEAAIKCIERICRPILGVGN